MRRVKWRLFDYQRPKLVEVRIEHKTVCFLDFFFKKETPSREIFGGFRVILL
jgi:hypothetical protein